MYRHDFNYTRAFILTGNGSIKATTPYNDKCSKQEGVKAGRPTPYIGAPSEVYFYSQGLIQGWRKQQESIILTARVRPSVLLFAPVFSSDFKDWKRRDFACSRVGDRSQCTRFEPQVYSV